MLDTVLHAILDFVGAHSALLTVLILIALGVGMVLCLTVQKKQSHGHTLLVSLSSVMDILYDIVFPYCSLFSYAINIFLPAFDVFLYVRHH